MTSMPGSAPSFFNCLSAALRSSSTRFLTGRGNRRPQCRSDPRAPDPARKYLLPGHLDSLDLLKSPPFFTARRAAALLQNCCCEIRPVRCAEDACGHATELTRGGSCIHTGRARRSTDDVAKYAPERAQAPPACLQGDLGNGQVAVAQ